MFPVWEPPGLAITPNLSAVVELAEILPTPEENPAPSCHSNNAPAPLPVELEVKGKFLIVRSAKLKEVGKEYVA